MQNMTVDAMVNMSYELNRRLLDVTRMLDNARARTHIKPLRVLFVGDDNGVKLAAMQVLARDFTGDICTVDVPTLISDNDGATESNLGAVLDDAEQRGDMLFFEEADALFGKRSAVSDVMPACLDMMDRCDATIIACVTGYYQLDLDVVKRFSCVVDFYAAGAAVDATETA